MVSPAQPPEVRLGATMDRKPDLTDKRMCFLFLLWNIPGLAQADA
jgi:hypothetical protein